MKKSYISPESLVVELRTKNMVAQMITQSLRMNWDEDVIDDANDILVKGYNTTNINIWDEEW